MSQQFLNSKRRYLLAISSKVNYPQIKATWLANCPQIRGQ
jgi:hypothetical protein